MAGQGGGSWKVAYADFVTAMMAFFLVMWILAQSKPVKQAIAQYFNDPWKTSSKPTGDRPGGASLVARQEDRASASAASLIDTDQAGRCRRAATARGPTRASTASPPPIPGLGEEGPRGGPRQSSQPVLRSQRRQPLRGHASSCSPKGPSELDERQPGPAEAFGGGGSRAAEQGRDSRARHAASAVARRPSARCLGAFLRPLPGHDEVPRAAGDRSGPDSAQPGRSVRALFARRRRQEARATTPASRSTCSASTPRTSMGTPEERASRLAEP